MSSHITGPPGRPEGIAPGFVVSGPDKAVAVVEMRGGSARRIVET
ncbi:hypothetical protein [Streptomyces longwoodensis]